MQRPDWNPPPWAIRLRRIVNMVNLSTPLGLLLARTGHARLEPGPHGTIVARGYRSGFPAPRASAVTVGDVVLLRLDDPVAAGLPYLLDHEARHTFQWAWFVGPFGFLPAYLLASAWSWVRVRDFALGNPFERGAGLVAGGYLRAGAADPLRPTDPEGTGEPDPREPDPGEPDPGDESVS